MESIERSCPICGSWEKNTLFHQYFSEDKGYDVVACDCCGFTFADHIPGQVQMDQYYQDQNKYNHPITPEEKKQFSELADLIDHFFRKNKTILEIGCSNGGLLNELKQRGFQYPWGLDPCPNCANFARSIYDVEVDTGTIASYNTTERFDLIILIAVLEHLVDLRGSLAKLKRMLSSHGQILIEVPDADKYDYSKSAYAPFMEFSVEHINYFTSSSLDRLMASYQFCRHYFSRQDYKNSTVLRVIYESNAVPPAGAEVSLKKYICDSNNAEQFALDRIEKLKQKNIPVVVWGIGSHTKRLWAYMQEMNIVSFVLTEGYGDTFKGIPVISPRQITNPNAVIFISSREHQETILKQIRELGLKNEVIIPYG